MTCEKTYSINYLRVAVIWTFISMAIGTGVGFTLMAIEPPVSRAEMFFACQILSLCVTLPCALTGYTVGFALRNLNFAPALALTILATTAVSLCGIGLCILLLRISFSNDFFIYFRQIALRLFIPTVIINVACTATATTIERSKQNQISLENQMQKIQGAVLLSDEGGPLQTLAIRDRGTNYILEHADIVYLSSHGKRTIIHTRSREYLTNQLLKDVEQRLLPGSFLRIHKQFIVNRRYIQRIRYFEGGRYILTLKDEEESSLPIGRNYLPLVKDQLDL